MSFGGSDVELIEEPRADKAVGATHEQAAMLIGTAAISKRSLAMS